MKNCTCVPSLLRPVVDYSSPVWNPSKKQIFVQVVYNNLNKVGRKTVPCGTPESTDNLEDVIPFKRTCYCLFPKKSIIQFDSQHGFRSKRSCETQLVISIQDLAKSPADDNQIDIILLDFHG
jgi:hypothetical protein